MDFEEVRDRIAFKLVNTQKTRYPLEEIPHQDFLDLSFVYFFVAYKDEEGMETVMIKNDHLSSWGISPEELHETASLNFSRIFSLQMMGPEDHMEKLVVCTTKKKLFGAVYMAHIPLLSTVAEAFGDDLCIIPSSIHEIILIPAKGLERETIDAMIRDVNRKAVREDEYLSDHMYLFSRMGEEVIF